MTAWMLLALGAASLLSAVNARRPLRAPSLFAAASFFAGWLTAELSLYQAAIQSGLAALLLFEGGLSSWPGATGLALVTVSSILLVSDHVRAPRVASAVEEALTTAFGEDFRASVAPEATSWIGASLHWGRLLFPFPVQHAKARRTKDIVYHEHRGRPLKLDVIRGSEPRQGCPTLIYVHGGGWVIGHRKSQGLPLMHHLASLGWVCFSIDYRLSPRATFPDHLVDVKRAIAWVREHGAEYGADPDFIVLSGNSAGGHLSALAALTPNRPEYQPGFEEADTRVSACVPFYGIYDFTDRHGHFPNRGLARLLERLVMKARLSDAPEEYEKASPIHWVSEDAPPFFLVHGVLDTLVPIAEARRFFAELKEKSHAPVGLAEIEGAQHAFEVFRSRRSAKVVRGVTIFLAVIYSRWLAERAATSAASKGRSAGRSSAPRLATRPAQA